MARGSNLGGGEIFCTCTDQLWGPPSVPYSGYWIFPGGKAAVAWHDHPPPSSAEVKESVDLYLYSSSGPLWPVQGELTTYILTCNFTGKHWHDQKRTWCRCSEWRPLHWNPMRKKGGTWGEPCCQMVFVSLCRLGDVCVYFSYYRLWCGMNKLIKAVLIYFAFMNRSF